MIGIEGGLKASLIGDQGIVKSPVPGTREVLDGRGEVWWGFGWLAQLLIK